MVIIYFKYLNIIYILYFHKQKQFEMFQEILTSDKKYSLNNIKTLDNIHPYSYDYHQNQNLNLDTNQNLHFNDFHTPQK